MKQKNIWLLLLGLVLTAGTILIDRFVISIPTWLTIIFIVIAIIAFIMFFITIRRSRR
jgi:hypothetical protein